MKCNSKRLQVLKHMTGGSYQLFMLISASFAGTWITGRTSIWYVVITGIIGITLQRISSQLDYWQSKVIIKEQLDNRRLSENV